MAAAKKMECTISKRTPIGDGLAIYTGVCTGGTEYETGGAEITEEATGSRYKFGKETKFLYFNCPTALLWNGIAAIGGNKVKILAAATVTNEKTGSVEYKNGETMATAFAAVPFIAIATA